MFLLFYTFCLTSMSYICSSCQYGSKIKVGKCPNCGEFATMKETEIGKQQGQTGKTKILKKTTIIDNNNSHHLSGIVQKFSISNPEIRSVLGEYIISAGVYLLAGEPGMGKSTLALQLIRDVLRQTPNLDRAYYSGEETSQQVIARWSRLYPDQSQIENFFHSSSCEEIIETVKHYKQKFIIVDSIQTIKTETNDSSPGSPAQVRCCSEILMNLAKQHHITVLIIGHVTKGGEIAWPKYLEHIVDVVLYLEWDRTGDMRFLRNYKNRFGHADGTGIFGMSAQGLQPLYEPEKLFAWQTSSPGIARSIGVDNGRAVLVRVETLLTKSYWKFPERHYVGVNTKRVDMIIAILEKHLDCKLAQYNIFVNIPWEFQLNDSGLDLAIAMAIYSWYKNNILPDRTVFVGELGLTGRISKTRMHEKRRSEMPKRWNMIDHEIRKGIEEGK